MPKAKRREADIRPIHLALVVVPMLLATSVKAADLQDQIAALLRGKAGTFLRPGQTTTITPQVFADRIAAAVGSPFGMRERQHRTEATPEGETDLQARIIASFAGKHI